MIYLFNSAYRALYRRNVLNTLSRPHGYTNDYRYRVTGKPRHISADAHAEFKRSPEGEDAVVIFIDRFAEGGYRFHPLRLARLIRTGEKNEYLHFYVELLEYIYPRDLAQFTIEIKAALEQHGLPRLTDNNPEATNDGNYAILAESIFEQKGQFYSPDDAWNAAVEHLAATRAYQDTDNEHVVFLRTEIRDSNGSLLEPRRKDVDAYYHWVKGARYTLDLSYRYPRQRVDQAATVLLSVAGDDNLRPSRKVVRIDSHANTVILAVTTKKHIEDPIGTLEFIWSSEREEVEILGTEQVLNIEVGDSVKAWFQIVIALLLFSLLGGFIGIDLPSSTSSTLQDYFTHGWPKIVASAIQAVMLFWLFKLIGKNIV